MKKELIELGKETHELKERECQENGVLEELVRANLIRKETVEKLQERQLKIEKSITECLAAIN